MTRSSRCAYIFILSGLLTASGAYANPCLPPERPFVPAESEAVREYSVLIMQDFETYFSEIGFYLQCLDEERQRAFQEAQEVSEEYGEFFNRTQSPD